MLAEASFSSLNDWLTWMETLHPSEIDLGLARIQRVADRLGIQQSSIKAKVITVAGTNGKGSCIASLEALLIASGARVGSYTSPHITHYSERIRLQSDPVNDEQLCAAFAQINSARGDISLTYFEFGTLAALLIFQAEDLDFYLLEIGLGGRLDAVNILAPDIAVITSIDYDHENWLGNTREAIAQEKLGILRTGTPCVCAETRLTETMSATFARLKTPLYMSGQEFGYRRGLDGQNGLDVQKEEQSEFQYSSNTGKQISLQLKTPGLPLPSVAAATQVYALCEDFLVHGALSQDKIGKVLQGLSLPGRFELLQTRAATWVFDVAHNPAATALLATNLKQSLKFADYAVVAMMADKKVQTALEPLLPLVKTWLPTELVGHPRSESSENIRLALNALSVDDEAIVLCQNTAAAIEEILIRIERADAPSRKPVVLVFGSFVTVAAAKNYFAAQLRECT